MQGKKLMKAPEKPRETDISKYQNWAKVFNIILTIIIMIWVTAPLWLAQLGAFLKIPNNPIKADAIVVLGGDGPERLLHAADLYKKNFSSNIWITGNMPLPLVPSLFERELARDFLIKNNIPSNSITLLNSTSTWEDSIAVAKEAKKNNIKSILLVTSWYHSRRAFNAFERNVAKKEIALGFSAPDHPTFTPQNWWKTEYGLTKVVEEYIKTIRYLLKYGF